MRHLATYRKTAKTKLSAAVALASLLVGSLSVAFPLLTHADTGTWVDGDMPVLHIVQQIASPPQTNDCVPTTWTYFSYTKPDGSFDSIGRDVDTPICSVQNPLGSYGGTANSDNYEFVKPNTSTAFRVLDIFGKQGSVTPVPGEPTFFTKDSSQSFFGEVAPHFYDSFPSAGSFGPFSYGSGFQTKELAFKISTSGNVLKDSANKTIYMHRYAFSQNGQWMVMEAANLGLLRVNTQTRAMQLFSTTVFPYNLGFTPYVALAISDDGNNAILGTDGGAVTYDLSGCQPGTFTVGASSSTNSPAMQGCRSRNVDQSLSSQLPGFNNLSQMHFNADGKSVNAIATRQLSGSPREYFTVTYSVAGYQAPHVGYLALGDSFSSGEGAGSYEQGTDSDNPQNTCHLSTLSYPYLAAQAVGITDFHNVACSGATTNAYYSTQVQNDSGVTFPLGAWEPGIKPQRVLLSGASNTSVVTISMIGNDIGFKDKLAYCIGLPDSCFHFREDRQAVANEIYSKFDTLVQLYKDIKKDSGDPDTVKVYVMGYPQLVGDGHCDANVLLDSEEQQTTQGMVSYLDTVIHAAADKAGVQYVDTEHAFDGHRLCESGSKAAHGLLVGNDVGPIGSESFHPTPLGQQLMEQSLMTQSQDLTKLMPAADSSKTAPYTGSDAYNNFIGNAPSANWNGLLYTSPTTLATRTALTAKDLVVKSVPLAIDVQESEGEALLKPSTPFNVWFQSIPTQAGTLTSDANGNLNGQIAIPSSLEPGFHILHLIGKDIGGNDIDMYQNLYIAANADDFNGDGIPNSQDPCLIVPLSGVDADQDGIDDACDGDITSPSSFTLWDDSITPGTTDFADPSAESGGVELGMKFKSSVDGKIKGVRFYKGNSNTGTHTGNLWSSTGEKLAAVTFSDETTSGWQEADFSTPVDITANTTYVVSYWAPNGHYSADDWYFVQSYTKAPLTALASAPLDGNGVYLYGGDNFPTSSYAAANYYVEPVFTTTNSVPAQPSPPSRPSDALTVFTNQTPLAAASGDSSTVQIGMKFHADTDGKVYGVRFYKGLGNDGVHVGYLWDGNGTLLGSARFDNETNSGWQEAVFAEPINITANATYAVSYFAPHGNYAFDSSYFTSSANDGALHAYDATSINGNGVYLYGAAQTMPTSSFNASNYWVDVVYKANS